MGLSVRVPALALAAAAYPARANYFHEWMTRQEAVLAAPTVAARIAEEQPLVLMVAGTVIVWALARQVKKAVQMLVLPGLQACGLQVLILIACLAIAPAFGQTRKHFHYDMHYRVLEYGIEGLVMLMACVVLPRRVLSYIPHRDVYSHYRKKFNQEPVRQTRNFSLVGPTDSSDDQEDLEQRIGDSVKQRSKRVVWFSRSAFVLLLVLRPLISPLLLSARWWSAHRIVDLLFLALGTNLVWFAGGEITKEIVHVQLPKYRHVAFIVCSCVWAFEMQHIMSLSIGIKSNELVMMSVLHVGEVAFVINMAAELLSPCRDPLVQIALARRSARAEQEARDTQASDDGSTVSDSQQAKAADGGIPARVLYCQLVRALFDVRRLLRELFLVGLPWPLNLGKDPSRSSSEDSESESISKPSAEVLAAHDSWSAWSGRTGIHPAWFGKRAPQFARVLTKRSFSGYSEGATSMVQQEILSPEEQVERMQRAGSVINKNSWWLVPADLFTDRVRSKLLAVVMVVILVVMTYSHDIFNQIIGCINNPVEALGLQLCLMALLWIAFGVLVSGNNAFVSRSCHRMWTIMTSIMCLGLSVYTAKQFFSRSQEFAGGGAVRIVDVFGDVQQRWADFSVGLLSFIGFFLSVHLFLSPEDSNDFHQCEFNALWYTSDLFQCAGQVAELRRFPPQVGEQLYYIGRSAEGDVKAVVEKDNGDGTCDVVLTDGRRLAQERHKFFRRSMYEGTEEGLLDAELKRLKALRPASEDYPAVLYLGAISALPLLTAMACALLLAVRTVLHVVYRMHVFASILTFCLHATVLPPGANVSDAQAVQTLARNVFAWRLDGGQGLANAQTLPSAANVTGLNVHMDWDGYEHTRSCSDLDLGEKIMVLLAMGKPHTHLGLNKIEKGITHTLKVIYGLDDAAVAKAMHALEAVWGVVSAGDPDFKLDSSKAGMLMCEAKLLSSVRLKSAGSAVLVAGQKIAIQIATNLTDVALRNLEGSQIGRFPVLINMRDVALHWLRELRSAMLGYAKGDVVARAQLVDNLESGLERSIPFVRAAKHLAGGGAPDAETIVQLLDRDGDGKLSIAGEAPALVNLGVSLCRKAGCGHMVESKIWEALAYADHDGDGELSIDDIRQIGHVLKESFRYGKRVLSGVCGTAGTAGVAAGLVGLTGIVENSERVPGWQELLAAFDANGDSALSPHEVMDPISKMATSVSGCKGSAWMMGEAEHLSDQAHLGNVLQAFRQADLNKDGKLTIDEAAVGGFAAAVAKLCPSEQPGADGAAAAGAGGAAVVETERRLGAVKDAAKRLIDEDYTDTEIVFGSIHADFGQAFRVADSFLGSMANQAICWILIGINWVLYCSVFVGCVCQLYVVGRCFSKYRKLFESMQAGRHDYVGNTSRGYLEQGFAETTMFPGMLFGTTFFGFIFVSILVFVVLIVAIVLCQSPLHGFWQDIYPVLLYLTLAFAMKEFIRYVVMDMLLAEKGEVVYPGLFSLFWFILLLLNFVLGVSTAVFRSVFVLLWAIVSCCFVDFTLMSEPLVSWDSAYYSLLTMAYTHHVRRNPIKKAMVTSLFRHLQSMQHKESPEESNSDGEAPARATTPSNPVQSRIRARFWLALTLHHNPELRHFRKQRAGREQGLREERDDPARPPASPSGSRAREVHAPGL